MTIHNSAHSIRGKMITHTGRLFSPLDPEPGSIDVRDIAYGLAGINRYGGHARYTVAEHCLLVSIVAERMARDYKPDNPEHYFAQIARWGLIHDAAEAYLGDQIAPLKILEGYGFLREAHDALTATIGVRLGVGSRVPWPIPQIDKAIISNEAQALFPVRPAEWQLSEPIPGLVVHGLSPADAEDMWLRRFRELWPDWRLQ